MNLVSIFDRCSKKVTHFTGSHYGFIVACIITFAGDKIITLASFIVLIFIQQSQNKDTKAIQMKLDEIIRAVENARNEVAGIEDKTDAEIENIKSDIPCSSN